MCCVFQQTKSGFLSESSNIALNVVYTGESFCVYLDRKRKRGAGGGEEA